MKRNLILLCLAALALIGYSCSEEDPSAGFTTTVGEVSEGAGRDTIVIDFGKQLSQDTKISFAVSGSAALDGDYWLSFLSALPNYNSTASSISATVNAGQSSLAVVINVIDDPFVEPLPEDLYIIITDVSDTDVASWLKYGVYSCVIYDNDNPPTDGLQVDLSWNLGDGVNINNANFDLYLIHNVQEDQGQIVSYDLVDGVSSTNDEGFETLTMGEALPDEEYYVLIHYTEGAYDALLTLIMSHDNSYARAWGVMADDSAGQDAFYGPITKSGTDFSRRAAPAWRAAP